MASCSWHSETPEWRQGTPASSCVGKSSTRCYYEGMPGVTAKIRVGPSLALQLLLNSGLWILSHLEVTTLLQQCPVPTAPLPPASILHPRVQMLAGMSLGNEVQSNTLGTLGLPEKLATTAPRLMFPIWGCKCSVLPNKMAGSYQYGKNCVLLQRNKVDDHQLYVGIKNLNCTGGKKESVP